MSDGMKIAGAAVMLILLIVIGTRVYALVVQENQLNASLADVAGRLAAAQTDETNLTAEAQYLANPLNLEKELRARFNYKKPGETMIIIVPTGTSTATSTD